MNPRSVAFALTLSPILAVASARADTNTNTITITPFLHGNAGDVEIRRGGPGLLLGYLHGDLGLELDASWHRHFYKDADLTSVPNPCAPGVHGPCLDDNTDAVLLHADAVALAPFARATRWRFYASVGGGFVYAWIHDVREYNSSQLHPTADAGVGATFWLKPWLGFRADMRWLHAFVDESHPDGGYAHDYDWFRLSLGVSFAISP